MKKFYIILFLLVLLGGFNMIGLFERGSREPGNMNVWSSDQLVELRKDNAVVTEYERKAFMPFRFSGGDPNFKDREIWKLVHARDLFGRYPGDPGFTKSVRTRDKFIDPKEQKDAGKITATQLKNLYDKNVSVDIIDLGVSIYSAIRDENSHSRKDPSRIFQPGSIISGTPTIGAAGTYATIVTYQADIGPQQDGDLIASHLDEETACGSIVTFDHDTNGYDCIIRPASGAAYNGIWGNGARINMGSGDYIKIATVDFLLSRIAIDARASNNRGVLIQTADMAVLRVVDGCLVVGDVNSRVGIASEDMAEGWRISNNIIYGFTHGSFGYGLKVDQSGAAATNNEVYNNSLMKCRIGLYVVQAGGQALIVKNNLLQGNTTDWSDSGSGVDTSAKNCTKDATGPDAGYNSQDKTGALVDYLNNNYQLAQIDSLLDDGEILAQVPYDAIGTVRAGVNDIGAFQYPRAVGGNGSNLPHKWWLS